MREATDRRGANLLGTLSLAIADRIREEATARAPSTGGAPAAIVALDTFLAGASIIELSRVLELSHSATVRLVDKLERAGLLQRRPGEDARAVAIWPTPAGRELAREIKRARLEALDDLLHPLSEGERAELVRLQEKMLASLVMAGDDPRRICRLCDAEACGHEIGCCPVTEAPRPPAAGT